MDPTKLQAIRDGLDKLRAVADAVRKQVDTVATVVASIPLVGGLASAYVKDIQLIVDGLDAAIDALDDAIDEAVPKASTVGGLGQPPTPNPT